MSHRHTGAGSLIVELVALLLGAWFHPKEPHWSRRRVHPPKRR